MIFKSIHSNKIFKLILVILSYALYTGFAGFLLINFLQLKSKSDNIENSINQIKNEQDNFKANFSEELYEEHLKLLDKRKTQNELDDLALKFEELSSTDQSAFTINVKEIYALYDDFLNKLKRNDGVKIDSSASKKAAESWGDLLIAQEFEEIETQLLSEISVLDASYKKYIDALPKPSTANFASGYTFSNVTTERGTSHGVYLIKVPLSQVRVKTIAAIEDDCKDNCATKSLEQYVNENNGFAGINGSYNCPPDYAACSGKTNSFDFAFYDSNDDEWFNENALSWSDTGMVTFSGSSADFYKKTPDYDGDSVTAAISNYPSLLKNGEVVIDEGDLTAYQKTRGLRGAIGFGNENIYLVHVTNATVTETAYVMKSLGALNALNLDGGGSAAMYVNGRYVLGPGRSLSNAIVLIK